jgi:hypothetical protein
MVRKSRRYLFVSLIVKEGARTGRVEGIGKLKSVV